MGTAYAMLKIGLLIPREGPAGIWGASCEASAMLAVAELNVSGGLLRREVGLIVVDAGSTAQSAAAAASSVVDLDRVEAVVAMVPSSGRRPILEELGGRVPFIYTPQFEGDENARGVITIGESAAELLAPGIAWLTEHKCASRFFLLGNNYLWPSQSMVRARGLIIDHGGTIVGEAKLPFGVEDHEQLLSQIKQARPHAVISWLLGHEAIVFNRAFAASGLAARVLRFSTAIDETILYGIGADCTENLYVSSAYFSSIRSGNNEAFLERYHQFFGETPPPANGFGESLYEGIHCLGGLVKAANSLMLSDLRRKVGRAAQSHTARSAEREILAGTARKVYMAAVDGCDFRLIDPG